MKIYLVLLAAGNSRRFGRNKLLETFGGKPMYRYVFACAEKLWRAERAVKECADKDGRQDGALRYEIGGVAAVSQYPEILDAARASGFLPVYNAKPEDGISGSIALGIHAVEKLEAKRKRENASVRNADEETEISEWAVCFAVCDQPYLRRETLERFLCEYAAGGKGIGCLSWNGEPGNPALFSCRYMGELLALSGDVGGKRIVRRHPEDVFLCEASEERELKDIDYPPQPYLWRAENGRAVKYERVCEAVGMNLAHERIVSFVGAGGKTTLVYRLAEELAALGARVLVTTTTKMMEPEKDFLAWEDAKRISWTGRVLTVGVRCGNGKIRGIPPEQYPRILRMTDYLIVEADGAKHKNIKIPAAHEPVIFPGTDRVIGVIGFSCVGETIAEAGFRPEELAGFLGKEIDSTITCGDVVKIAQSREGLQKSVDCPSVVILNQYPREEVGTYRDERFVICERI